MPSGCMSNLIAMMTHVRVKGHSCIMGNKCHIYTYERGNASAVANIFPHVINHQKDGTFDLDELEARIPLMDDEHLA